MIRMAAPGQLIIVSDRDDRGILMSGTGASPPDTSAYLVDQDGVLLVDQDGIQLVGS